MMHSHEAATSGVPILLGLLLVFAGRRVFWLFVGGVGFLAGVHLAPQIAGGHSHWLPLLLAIALGLIGALLAVVIERIAIALAGWLAGGLLATRIVAELGWTDQQSMLIAFIVGAIVVALVLSVLFDWALIALSSIVGAFLVSDSVHLEPSVRWMLAAILIVVGLIVQSRSLSGRRSRSVTEPAL